MQKRIMIILVHLIVSSVATAEECTFSIAPNVKSVGLTIDYIDPSSYWGYPGGGPFVYQDGYEYMVRGLEDILSAYEPPFHYYSGPFSPTTYKSFIYLWIAPASDSSRRVAPTMDSIPQDFIRKTNIDGVHIDLQCPDGFSLVQIGENRHGDHHWACQSTANCQDPKNNGFPDFCPEGNPINQLSGNKLLIETYISSSPSNSLSLRVVYNSTFYASGMFGWNWMSNFDQEVYVMTEGENAQAYNTRADGVVNTYARIGNDWVADPDVIDKLVEITDGAGVHSGWRVETSEGHKEIYDEQGKLERIEYLGGYVVLLSYDIEESEGGDRMSATLDEVLDNRGRRLVFDYRSDGKVSIVEDHEGNAFHFSYSEEGLLKSVTYPDEDLDEINNPKRIYSYDDPNFPLHLTGIIDETGSRYATYCYDSEGRAVLTEHGVADIGDYIAAAGSTYADYCANVGDVRANVMVSGRVEFTYNADNTTEVKELIDQKTLGTAADDLIAERTYHYTTLHGVLKTTQITGDQCSDCGGQFASTAYDANGFVASRTDFQGNVTVYKRNLRGLAKCTIEGHTAAASRRTERTWHPDFRLPLTESTYGLPQGTVGGPDCETPVGSPWTLFEEKIYTYDSAGRLASQTTLVGSP